MNGIGWIAFLNLVAVCVCDVTYTELEDLKSCSPWDSCAEERSNDDLQEYNCHCGPFCQQLNTCCVDSKYNTDATHSRIQCSPISSYGYSSNTRHVFMVDDCMPGWEGDPSVPELCKSGGKRSDDPFLSVPVTHPISGVTYKNYYCSICNNETEDEEPVAWDLILRSSSEEVTSTSIPEFHYNSTRGAWTFGSEATEVYVSVFVPKELINAVHFCVADIISDCHSTWTDSATESKCQSYMALSRFSNREGEVTYRNPHCAICNFENLEEMRCYSDSFDFQIQVNVFFTGLFSLHDKTKKCEGSKFYDALAKKCRTIYKG